eukprot:TRINITY_DN18657_c0_g1_i2.p1 TRINITY_DN18657_c0_g1~~TRINITY_DN18657_c0_g1_i2.p1  ORF type:complete len:237 (+),score=37.45 TRINITY_DN18657_c0_g1_i2:138-848(+)
MCIRDRYQRRVRGTQRRMEILWSDDHILAYILEKGGPALVLVARGVCSAWKTLVDQELLHALILAHQHQLDAHDKSINEAQMHLEEAGQAMLGIKPSMLTYLGYRGECGANLVLAARMVVSLIQNKPLGDVPWTVMAKAARSRGFMQSVWDMATNVGLIARLSPRVVAELHHQVSANSDLSVERLCRMSRMGPPFIMFVRGVVGVHRVLSEEKSWECERRRHEEAIARLTGNDRKS